MNLFEHLRTHFPADPDRAVIRTAAGDELSYGWLNRRSAGFAEALGAMEVAERGVVAVQVDKCPDFLALYLAVLRSGRVFLPLNPTYTAAEVEYFLADAHAGLLVCQPERSSEMETVAGRVGTANLLTLGTEGGGTLVERAEQTSAPGSARAVMPRDDGQAAVLLYTSGTTGKPKGAVLSHGNVRAMIDGLHTFWGWSGDDVLLHALPLFHIHGLFVDVK